MFYPKNQSEIVNIGSPQEHTVLKYAQMVKKTNRLKSKIVFSEKLPSDDPKKRRPKHCQGKKTSKMATKGFFTTRLLELINSLKKTV